MRKRNKIKVGLVLVIWGILFVTSLAGQAQDDIYEKYCTKGKQGYYRFRYEVIGIKKKEFWQTFIAMVQNFYSKKEIGKLLNCSLFWNEFKQDDFFDIHNQRLSEGKEKIDKIVEFVVSGKIYEYKQNRIFKKFYKNKQGYWEGVLKDSGIILVLIPAGTFIMGSDNGDNDERPAHSVYLDEYWIGKYEITTYNYHQFLRKKRKDEPIDTYLQLPARWISWNEAVEFCMWLSEKTGLMVYLPTEAQWEKAARG